MKMQRLMIILMEDKKKGIKMDTKELYKIMVEHGVVLRAIPDKIVKIYEKQHFDKYPDGTIKYMEEFEREMLIVEQTPINAGKIIMEQRKDTGSIVVFTGKKFYDSIEQAVADLTCSISS